MNEVRSVNLAEEVTGENLFPVTPKKRKKPINKEAIAGTIFASGPLIGFLLFGVIPLCLAFAMAFLKMRGFSFFGAKLSDPLFANFKTVVEDDKFWDAILNTLILGTSTLISLVLSLIIAYLLSKEIRGKKIFRMIYFVPYVCSAVAVVLMWGYIFNTEFGILQSVLRSINENWTLRWTKDAGDFRTLVILISVWGGMGYAIVLFTAALTNVNRSTVEAATIDGAGPFRVFWNVVFPAISPTTFFLLVTGLIGALQSFATSNILAKDGGPDSAGITIVFYLYNKIFKEINMGVASASAWILSLLILIITIFNFVGSKKWVSYDQ